MANLTDVINRTQGICKKYEKYVVTKDDKKDHVKSADPFMDEYTTMIDKINELNLKADEIANEKNRALKATLNAELRKSKATLLETDLVKIEKLVRKGKAVSKEIMDDRASKVKQLKEMIEQIPDGVNGPRKPYKPVKPGSARGGAQATVTLSGMTDQRTRNPEYYEHTAESSAFKQEWEVAKVKQDRALDNIEKGLSTLKGIGEAMHDTLNQQDILIDEIDAKMDTANAALKTNNMKLHGLVTATRSSRNFCIDVTLLCIVLGIALYIYKIAAGK